MTTSTKTRNALRRATSPSPSAGTEVADLLDQRRGPATALTDADATVQIGGGAWRRMPAATLSANRAITLGTTGAKAGDQIEFTRLDVGAFTLAFINGGAGAGTLYTMAVSVKGYARFQFDGTNWALRAFGVQ